MATTTITGMTAVTTANLTDAAVFEVEDSGADSRKATLAQVRTRLGTTSSATDWSVGPNGSTNPAWQIDCSVGSLAAGLKLTGATSAGTVALAVISSGAAASLSINAKGTGTIAIGSVSTGAITITPATKIVGAFGCNNATPQTAATIGAALAAYATGAFGLDSDANMSALHADVVAMRAALVANGILVA